MKTIWKIELKEAVEIHNLPKGAKFLFVGNQQEKICLWFEVNNNAELEQRRFEIAGTGNSQMDGKKTYLGSAIFSNGNFVWHVYELSCTQDKHKLQRPAKL